MRVGKRRSPRKEQSPPRRSPDAGGLRELLSSPARAEAFLQLDAGAPPTLTSHRSSGASPKSPPVQPHAWRAALEEGSGGSLGRGLGERRRRDRGTGAVGEPVRRLSVSAAGRPLRPHDVAVKMGRRAMRVRCCGGPSVWQTGLLTPPLKQAGQPAGVRQFSCGFFMLSAARAPFEPTAAVEEASDGQQQGGVVHSVPRFSEELRSKWGGDVRIRRHDVASKRPTDGGVPAANQPGRGEVVSGAAGDLGRRVASEAPLHSPAAARALVRGIEQQARQEGLRSRLLPARDDGRTTQPHDADADSAMYEGLGGALGATTLASPDKARAHAEGSWLAAPATRGAAGMSAKGSADRASPNPYGPNDVLDDGVLRVKVRLEYQRRFLRRADLDGSGSDGGGPGGRVRRR